MQRFAVRVTPIRVTINGYLPMNINGLQHLVAALGRHANRLSVYWVCVSHSESKEGGRHRDEVLSSPLLSLSSYRCNEVNAAIGPQI